MSRSGPNAEKPVVVVIDDDGDVRGALEDLLDDAGYQAVCTAGGREALKYLRRNAPPAALLLDLFMPEMNGWELVQTLKTTPKLAAVPVIMVTGNQPHWGYPVPETMVVRKPIDPDRLLALLREVARSAVA